MCTAVYTQSAVTKKTKIHAVVEERGAPNTGKRGDQRQGMREDTYM